MLELVAMFRVPASGLQGCTVMMVLPARHIQVLQAMKKRRRAWLICLLGQIQQAFQRGQAPGLITCACFVWDNMEACIPV